MKMPNHFTKEKMYNKIVEYVKSVHIEKLKQLAVDCNKEDQITLDSVVCHSGYRKY